MTHTYLNKLLLFSILISICGTNLLQAQVTGLSYTLAPRAAYLFTDSRSGVGNTFALGGDFGIGFGQFVELRANYLQGISTKTDFDGFDFVNANALAERDITLTRFGGDVKLNIGKGRLLPYLTLGVGVQKLEADGREADRNIYGSGGVGLVLSAADRYTFYVEGRFTGYNQNPVRGFLDIDDVQQLGIIRNDFSSEQQKNYSVEAGLAFYLSGQRPTELSEVDRAYKEQFGNGFRGLSFLVEPTLSRINFDNTLPYRDTWLGGAAIGTNFGPLVGVRAYYLQAMEGGDVTLDFDDLAIYGADFRFNLNNVATGIAPYISLGGGYIDADNDYIGRDLVGNAKSQGFAAGGGGIVLGLTRNLKLRAGAKVLLTSGTEIDAVQSTDQITTSTQYSFGINLAFGRKATEGQAVVDRQREEALRVQQMENKRKTAELRTEYEERLASVEAELNEAYQSGDTVRVQELRQVQRQTAEILEEIESRPSMSVSGERQAADGQRMMMVDGRMVAVAPSGKTPSGGYIRMSAAEFENLIEEILAAPAPNPYAFAPGAAGNPAMYGMDSMSRGNVSVDQLTAANKPLLDEMRALRQDLMQMQTRISNLERQTGVTNPMNKPGQPSDQRSEAPNDAQRRNSQQQPAVKQPAPQANDSQDMDSDEKLTRKERRARRKAEKDE